MSTALVSQIEISEIAGRVGQCDWLRIEKDLNERGSATTGTILTPQECEQLANEYENDSLYRSRVIMARHGFGRGEYKYYSYPLPDLIAALRSSLYEKLAPMANRWHETLGEGTRFPPAHADYLEQCHNGGQGQPTPLILRYEPGDYNCLHQDLYGDLVFPLQVAFLLSSPGTDFTGGEFAMTEQRPRMQSRVEVVNLHQGEGVVFAVNQRPVRGTRGVYRVAMRHGVSRLRSGRRFTVGIIFHDAK